MTPKWNFPFSNDGQGQGLLSAGKAMFSENIFENTVREIVQNSLDASDDNKPPVHLEVREIKVDMHDVNGKNLKQHFDACKEEIESQGDDLSNSKKMVGQLQRGINALEGASITCLAFIDSNTCGLIENNWKAIIGEGLVYKNTKSPGGSYGMGKDAPVALSDLNTIVYSTRYIGDIAKGREEKMIGVSKLMTHKMKGQERQATGFFPKKSEPLRGSDIPEVFRLQDTGTGVFILGFNPERHFSSDETLESEIRKSICKNFFHAIYHDKLHVSIITGDKPTKINKDTLALDFEKELKKIKDRDERESLSRAYSYFKVVQGEPQKIEVGASDFGKLKNIDLFIHLENDAPNRVAFLNKNGMFITDSRDIKKNPFHPRRNFPEDFSAVIIPSTDEGDRWITSMHNPPHNEISVGFLDPDEKSETKTTLRQLANIRSAIREAIGEIVDENISQIDNLYELAQSFPEWQSDGKPEKGEGQSDFFWHEIKPIPPKKSRTGTFHREENDEEDPDAEEPIDTPGPNPNPDPRPQPRPKPPVVQKEEKFINPRIIRLAHNKLKVCFSMRKEVNSGTEVFVQIIPRGFEYKKNNHPIGIERIDTKSCGKDIKINKIEENDIEYLSLEFNSKFSEQDRIAFIVDTYNDFDEAVAFDIIEVKEAK